MFDNVLGTIYCPQCAFRMSRSIGWLKEHHVLSCEYCAIDLSLHVNPSADPTTGTTWGSTEVGIVAATRQMLVTVASDDTV